MFLCFPVGYKEVKPLCYCSVSLLTPFWESLVTCTHFPLYFFLFGSISVSKMKIILSLLSLNGKSLTEISVEGEAEKRFHTFQ